MAIVHAAPTARVSAPSPAGGRDPGIDLVRALCVAGVVILHSLMVGVGVTVDGPVFDNASVGTWWIVPLSWALQVMPLFFVIGGFSGLLAYRSSVARGGSARSFVAARIHRLLRPAVVTIGVVGLALLGLGMLGVPPELIVVAGFRYGQPLWFLGVFLLCQALLPLLAAAHERAPLRMMAVLTGAAVAVDAVRASSGIDGLGFVNLVFVWLALQQLGFFLADGRIDALARRTRMRVGIGAAASLLALFATGVYSPDLIANINPPTAALLLVGIAHTSVLSLHRDRLRRVSRHSLASALSGFVTPRTMTIYLWHMPVLLAMAGLTAVWALSISSPLPAIDSAEWWLGRPLWVVTALFGTAMLAIPLSRIEARAMPVLTASATRVALACACGLVAVVLLLVVGTGVATALVAVALLLTALALASTGRGLSASLRARHRRAGRVQAAVFSSAA